MIKNHTNNDVEITSVKYCVFKYHFLVKTYKQFVISHSLAQTVDFTRSAELLKYKNIPYTLSCITLQALTGTF